MICWVTFAQEDKVPITCPIIPQEVLKFANETGYESFNAFHGWLTRVNERQHLFGKVVSREEGNVKEHCGVMETRDTARSY